ncbi:MAG: 5-(carboxyamino)imidazole ribonucleotide synthase [Methylotenera sp.]|uniref:5-(carboxyamino)imidazole ribonucleotide synthase n=1 Tax=Methylotenera sp. TaxID=2051956 RepID=UPI00248A39D0|nr:5-(carboxyamino)imidazole ribonucleotide synthase [Methylotenera sp.]MDI1310248.1 5-(carboxyamino)imidazole ribonucleotide synthase [Methylotenera sp.]
MNHHQEQTSVILPPAMLGMLGGGQLGRFFVVAAHEMGYKVTVLDPDVNSPAGKIADVHICAAFDDKAALLKLANTCEAITTEFENVPADSLSFLAETKPVRPSAYSVAIAQHRVSEKNFLKHAGLPVAPFEVINEVEDLPNDDSDIYPAILKVARFGYDGKGQARVINQHEAQLAFAQFEREECVLEKMLKLDYEVSVVLARDVQGNVATFPTSENSHLNGILDVSIIPARGRDAISHQAQKLAILVAEKLAYTGVLGVEFFVCNGELLVNEIAPRPHNSGHYTIDACVTNQFEQQVRAMTGLPLGSARQHSSAVMVNLLGDIWPEDSDSAPEWQVALNNPMLKMHLYGKQQARLGRKMGHFTVINVNRDEALKQAMQVRADLKIGEQ